MANRRRYRYDRPKAATSRYGTALAGFYLAKERGLYVRVYADETRPVLQGARLTAWELTQSGIF